MMTRWLASARHRVIVFLALLSWILAACGPATSSDQPTAPAPATVTPTAIAPTGTAMTPPPMTSAPSPTVQVPAGSMSIPAAGATVTLPLHIMAQVGRPGEQVTSLLRWNDGTERTYTTTTLDDGSGHGLLIVTPPWWPDTPLQPASQAAVLELHDAAGALLARQSITVLDPSDARVQQVQVFWTVSGAEVVQPQIVHIVRTEHPAAAVLEELLWGPPPATQVGFGTALPVPQEVLAFPGRQADWGTRVTLRSLKIDHDEAHVDLSREMLAFGGGSARVRPIREQITRTLAQFGSLHEVHITVEGREHVLEP